MEQFTTYTVTGKNTSIVWEFKYRLNGLLLLNRKGKGIELNPSYFLDGVQYCKAAENKMEIPSLFDVVGETKKEIC